MTSEPEESLLLLEDCCDEEESEKWGVLTKFHSCFFFLENNKYDWLMKGKKNMKNMKQKVLLIPSRSKKWQGINRLSNFGFQSSSNLNTNNYKYLATLVYYKYLLPHVILTSNSQIRKVPNLEKPSYDFKNTVICMFLHS